MDLLSLQWNATSNALSLMASDDDHGGALYASNECVVICPESMKFTLPGGTPLGNEGDPAVDSPAEPLCRRALCRCVRRANPRRHVQRSDDHSADATRRARANSCSGRRWDSASSISGWTRGTALSSNDYISIPVGGHAHYNWGFTTSGVYHAYFQASGKRPGQSTNTVSPETPFTFTSCRCGRSRPGPPPTGLANARRTSSLLAPTRTETIS